MSNITRLWHAIRQSGQGVYQPALARQQLTVVSVETDSNGAVTAARGTIGGEGDFSVPVRGAGVRVGMLIGVTQPAHDPAAPLTFDGIDSTDDPSAGFSADDDADLPVPAWAGTPLTTAVEASPGRISSRVTAHFVPVSAKYKPSGYILFYSLDAGTMWITMTTVDDDGSTAYAVPLSRSFEPGTSVEVKLRAVYKSGARSIASSTHTITAAADTTTPGTATTVTVDNTVAGQLLCTVTASTVTASLFLKWRYEFSTSGSGPYSAATEEPGPCVFTGAAGAWYVRVAPVSKSGTVGTYTSWTGPTTLTVASAPRDTTPPADWPAPTVSLTRVTPDTGGEFARLSVALPAYSYASDYSRTIIRAENGTQYLERTLTYDGGAHDSPQVWPNVAFGTWTVTLQGVDTSDNRSAVSSTGSATLASSGVPAAAGLVTTTSVSLAVRLDFTRPTNALIVKIWRATSSGGAGAAVIAQVDGNSFIDSAAASGAIAGTVYYYKIQGTNIGGDGTISSTWVAGTVGAYDGANIAVNSVEANVLKASTVLTSLLKTAASGTRWEIEGHTGGGNQDQFRAYENVSGTDKLRMLLNGAGLTFYDNSGAAVGQMYVSSGSAYISLHGVLLSATALNMGATFELGWGSGGSSSTADTVLTRRAAGILGIAGDFVVDGGTVFLNSARTRYLDWDTTQYLVSGGNFLVSGGDLIAVRSGATGYVYLGDQSGGVRYVGYDGSNYVMPNANLYVNGSIVLTSSRALKEQIRALPAMREKLRQLTPKRFRRTDRPSTRDEYGYIAEEVEAIAPHAVTEMDLTPPPTRDQDGNEIAAEPVTVKGINPLALLAVIHQGLSEGLAALEARVAALEGRGGTP